MSRGSKGGGFSSYDRPDPRARRDRSNPFAPPFPYNEPRGYPRASLGSCVKCGGPIIRHEGDGPTESFVAVVLVPGKTPTLKLQVRDRSSAFVDCEKQGRELSALVALHGGLLYRITGPVAGAVPNLWRAVAVFPSIADAVEASAAIGNAPELGASIVPDRA
jgi:hypothetical protein